MINIILNTIGVLLIIYSIYIIKKDLLYNEKTIDQMNLIEEKTKKYYEYTDNVVSSFNELVDLKLDSIHTESLPLEETKDHLEYRYSENLKREIKPKDQSISEEKTTTPLKSDHKKIVELLELGLNEEEIAKKLHKGVREINIIIRMYKNKY